MAIPLDDPINWKAEQEPVQDKTDLLRLRWIWPDFPILFVKSDKSNTQLVNVRSPSAVSSRRTIFLADPKLMGPST